MQQPKEQLTALALNRKVEELRETVLTERCRIIRLETQTRKLKEQILELQPRGNSNGSR